MNPATEEFPKNPILIQLVDFIERWREVSKKPSLTDAERAAKVRWRARARSAAREFLVAYPDETVDLAKLEEQLEPFANTLVAYQRENSFTPDQFEEVLAGAGALLAFVAGSRESSRNAHSWMQERRERLEVLRAAENERVREAEHLLERVETERTRAEASKRFEESLEGRILDLVRGYSDIRFQPRTVAQQERADGHFEVIRRGFERALERGAYPLPARGAVELFEALGRRVAGGMATLDKREGDAEFAIFIGEWLAEGVLGRAANGWSPIEPDEAQAA